MNYYPFHIGDYRSSTAHLSNEEDLAYRRLLDMYYDSEQPIPLDTQWVSRRLRVGCETVQAVLRDFFQETPDGWVQAVAERKIAEYHALQEKNRKNGSKGGRPKNPVGFQSVSSGNPVVTDSKGNQEPITNNQINTPIPPLGAEPTKKSNAVSLAVWLDSMKATGEKAIPETDEVFAYAEKVGIPKDFLRLCWLAFRDHYFTPGAKKYKDWRSVFRKAVKGNWMKVWWIDGNGEYQLTTVGKQAERKAA